MCEPIAFQPIYQRRVWGGREMERRLGRTLPADGQPYGESWDVVDRPEAQSVVVGGSYDGWTLHRLWQERSKEVFGVERSSERFPVLCKVLDARDRLSVQVHPPARVAAALGGEPKSEVWHVLEADPGAELYVGLRAGVTREAFASSLLRGGVEELLHTIRPRPGDSVFLESGRVHAIGGGLLILEIQQNSDTTYRVHDWNRMGLDGRPRELHVEEALASIDFGDVEPSMRAGVDGVLAEWPGCRVERMTIPGGGAVRLNGDGRFRLVAVAEGTVSCGSRGFGRGCYFLLPRDGEAIRGSPGAAVVVAGIHP